MRGSSDIAQIVQAFTFVLLDDNGDVVGEWAEAEPWLFQDETGWGIVFFYPPSTELPDPQNLEQRVGLKIGSPPSQLARSLSLDGPIVAGVGGGVDFRRPVVELRANRTGASQSSLIRLLTGPRATVDEQATIDVEEDPGLGVRHVVLRAGTAEAELSDVAGPRIALSRGGAAEAIWGPYTDNQGRPGYAVETPFPGTGLSGRLYAVSNAGGETVGLHGSNEDGRINIFRAAATGGSSIRLLAGEQTTGSRQAGLNLSDADFVPNATAGLFGGNTAMTLSDGGGATLARTPGANDDIGAARSGIYTAATNRPVNFASLVRVDYGAAGRYVHATVSVSNASGGAFALPIWIGSVPAGFAPPVNRRVGAGFRTGPIGVADILVQANGLVFMNSSFDAGGASSNWVNNGVVIFSAMWEV